MLGKHRTLKEDKTIFKKRKLNDNGPYHNVLRTNMMGQIVNSKLTAFWPIGSHTWELGVKDKTYKLVTKGSYDIIPSSPNI